MEELELSMTHIHQNDGFVVADLDYSNRHRSWQDSQECIDIVSFPSLGQHPSALFVSEKISDATGVHHQQYHAHDACCDQELPTGSGHCR